MTNLPSRFRPFAETLFGSDNRQALFALASLLYLGFLFMPLLVPPMAREHWLMASLVSVVVFMPMYVLAWRSRSRWKLAATAGIGLLGFVLLPWNLSANTYVIYAAAVLGAVYPWRQAIPGVLLTVAAFAGWHVLLGLPLVMAAMTCLLATAASVGNAVGAAYARKDAALRLSQDDVRQLARLAERERIGRDLHDLLGHTLSVIVLKAELANRLYERDRDGARREIAEVERIARETLGQVRRAVTGIRAAGLRAELVSARLALDAVGVDLDYEGNPEGLPVQVETVLALVLREAVTNIVRHAGAERVRVVLERTPRALELSIDDDGRGGKAAPGTGLTGMRERVEGAGGRFEWRSDGKGTHIEVRMPLEEKPERYPQITQHAQE